MINSMKDFSIKAISVFGCAMFFVVLKVLLHGLVHNNDKNVENDPFLEMSSKYELIGGSNDNVDLFGGCFMRLSINNTIPDKFDWRDIKFGSLSVISPVANQKMCNACWAVCIAQLMETMSRIQGIDNEIRSIQQILDCGNYSYGCYTGEMQRSLDSLCRNHYGITTEVQYPLKLVVDTCPKTTYTNLRRIKQYKYIDEMDEDDILAVVYHHGPVAVTVNILPWIYYIDGIIETACPDETDEVLHQVQVVGYDKSGEVPHYIIKNSWGDDWGESGYVRVAMYRNLCGITDRVIFLTVE